jgi:glycerol transport system ATP-binding protein
MLGGHVVVMDEGRILQTGFTPEVYHNPATLKVAQVFSDPPINYLAATVQTNKAILGKDIEIPLNGHLGSLEPGNYTFGVRCNHLFLSRVGKSDAEIRAKVELAEITGSETFIHVNHGDTHLVIQEDGVHQRRIGSDITIFVNPGCFFVYDQTGRLVASPSRPAATGKTI